MISCPETSTVDGPQIGNLSCEEQAEYSGVLSDVCLVCVCVCVRVHSRKMFFANTCILVAGICHHCRLFPSLLLMENPVERSCNANPQFVLPEDSTWRWHGEPGTAVVRNVASLVLGGNSCTALLNPAPAKGPPGEGGVID